MTPAQDATALADDEQKLALAEWFEAGADIALSQKSEANYRLAAQIIRASLRATSQTPDAVLEAAADAIDAARYAHPDHPRERPRSFAEADRSDREYAVRLARAALSTPSASARPQAEAGYTIDNYHRGYRDGWETAHEPAPCGHARANWKDPKFGTPEYKGDEQCEICATLAHPQPQQADGRGAVIEDGK